MLRFILRLIWNGRRRSPRRRSAGEVRPQLPAGQFVLLAQPKTKAASGTVIKDRIPRLPKAQVIHVLDGDTVILSRNPGDIRVRLDSIDCPEDGQHWGDTAKYGLIKLIGNKIVHLEEHGLDGYGRTLATLYVWHPERNLWLNVNERMVTLGHAWVMRQFYDHLPQDRQAQLNRLERWARSKRVGLWATSNPTPPWTWRNGR